MNDKRREYGVMVSEPHELLGTYPELATRIEEELVHKLTVPIVKEAVKGECIVQFTETEQRQDLTTGLIEFRKHVYIEEIVRCKDCKYIGSKLFPTDDYHTCKHKRAMLDAPADGFCCYGERRSESV